jgi:N,N'-diacetyllegionaminate synthase
MSVFVIAEIGPNHDGDLDRALEMVSQLSTSGADAIKFQLAVPDNVYSADAFKADYQRVNDGEGSPIEMSRRIQLPREAHIELEKACRDVGIEYLCTAFDIDSLRFLDTQFSMPYFKIPSGEILTIDMLKYIGAQKKPVLLSTGMASFDEITEALDALDPQAVRDDITILHCVSNYPAPSEDINLAIIQTLRDHFHRPVGFSDHSLGAVCCLGAVAMGATVIEKHVTLDKSLPGPDHKASATINEFKQLVSDVRTLEAAIGVTGEKRFSAAETRIRQMARKSIVAARAIPAGKVICMEDLTFKRPGTGISPMRTKALVGASAKVDIAFDTIIRSKDLTDKREELDEQ